MDFEAINRHICRICMDDDILLDWNEELLPYYGMSFKHCYYKYSQLALIDPDPYPQFVCEACSKDLQNFHLFIEKAIETQNLLEQDFQYFVKDYQSGEGEVTPKTECIYLVDNCGDREDVEPMASNMIKKKVVPEISCSLRRGARKKLSRKNLDDFKSDVDSNLKEYIGSDEDMYVPPSSKRKRNISKDKTVKKKGLQEIQYVPATKAPRNGSEPDKQSTAHVGKLIQAEINVKCTKKRQCTYCSKFVNNLKKHELTHKEDRARLVICYVCGLKAFNSGQLQEHVKIHQKNREKKFKCEFCDKAFFNRGACNIHRRIHLGQMVKCPLCPKEYYRQIDLDRHMPSHSTDAPQPQNSRSRLKYMVHCKECNKQVNSAKFNAHRAAHLNDPQMRCTPCEKDFFSRGSCNQHMKKVHKRALDNYDDLVMYYEKYRPRLSHVLMEQQQEVLIGPTDTYKTK